MEVASQLLHRNEMFTLQDNVSVSKNISRSAKRKRQCVGLHAKRISASPNTTDLKEIKNQNTLKQKENELTCTLCLIIGYVSIIRTSVYVLQRSLYFAYFW